jgi:hypothetical protein
MQHSIAHAVQLHSIIAHCVDVQLANKVIENLQQFRWEDNITDSYSKFSLYIGIITDHILSICRQNQ